MKLPSRSRVLAHSITIAAIAIVMALSLDAMAGTVPGADFVWEYESGQAVTTQELFSGQQIETIPRLCLLDVSAAVKQVNPLVYYSRDITADGVDETFCNWFVADVLSNLGISVPRYDQSAGHYYPSYLNSGHMPWTAGTFPPDYTDPSLYTQDIPSWDPGWARHPVTMKATSLLKPYGATAMANYFASRSDWTAVSAATAMSDADNGQVVVAVSATAGHVAILVPSGGAGQIQIAQAGQRCTIKDPVAWGFASYTPTYYVYSASVVTPPTKTFNLRQGLNFISFPFTPKAGASRKFADIFQSLGTDLFPYVFYVNGDGSIGLDRTSNLDAVGKKGYLIFLQTARTCQVTGDAVDPTVTLHSGCNAVGVTSSTIPAYNSYVWPTAYYLDSTGTLQGTSIFVNGLQPGVAYFMFCSANDVTLVPSTGAGQSTQKDITLRTGAAASTAGRAAAGVNLTSIGTDFSCQITVSQTTAGASPVILNFGMKPGASDGYDDGLDELAAPPLPGNMTAKVDESYGLKSSYKASSASASWPLVVRSESADTDAVNTNPMVISWVIPLSGAVDPNTLFELLDSAGNVLVFDMRRTTQTSFSVAASSTERHFTIRASLVGPIPSVTPLGVLWFGGNPGGPFSPLSTHTYCVANTGMGTLNWTLSANQNWVTVTPNSGTDAGTVSIAINSNANSLPGGVGGVVYPATLTFGGNGGTLTRQINLVVYEGNRVPQVSPSTPQGMQSGGVPISFLIFDDESDPCYLQVQYSTNGGGTWHAATPRIGYGTTGLSSSPNGETHLYVWDSVADLGYVANSNIRIQMTPTDPGGTGWTIATSSFSVDNTAVLPPPTPISPGAASSPGSVLLEKRPTFAWTAVPGAAGYRCYVYDAESNYVTGWSLSGGSTNCQLWLSSFPNLAKLHWFVATINSNDAEGAASSSGLYFQTPAPNISVTVQANPSGRSFTVDGMTFNYTVFFSWLPGSEHTISTTSPQSGAAGTQYVWQNWSDGQGMTHIVTPTVSTTYTANSTTQFDLTMSTGTGGASVSPGSGWYNNGATSGISATAASGYYFSSWTGSGSGSYSGANDPVSITMIGPIGETANFIAIPMITCAMTDNQPVLCWSSNATGFAVQSTPTLGFGCSWTSVPQTPVIVGDHYTVTDTVSWTSSFYRLWKP